MSFSHRSTAARAFVRPRGQRPSTSTRTPSASDAGSYTRLTWIDETIRVSSSESTILRAARREKLKRALGATAVTRRRASTSVRLLIPASGPVRAVVAAADEDDRRAVGGKRQAAALRTFLADVRP